MICSDANRVNRMFVANTLVNTLICLISLFSFTYCCVHFSLSFSLIYFKCYIYLNIVVMLQHKSFYLFLYFTTRYQSIPYIYTFNSHPPTDVHIEHFRKPNKIEAYILKETLIKFVFLLYLCAAFVGFCRNSSCMASKHKRIL